MRAKVKEYLVNPANQFAPKRKMGRPTIYTPVIAAEICRRISLGESLRTIVRIRTMPSRSTVLRWQNERTDFRSQYVKARDDMVDALAEEVLEMSKTATKDNVAQRRLYSDNVKWYTGKVAPKKYGDKIDVNVTGQVTVGDAIEEGRKRVARLKGGTT